MNIPILNKEVNEFHLVRDGKTSVGLDNYRILCDEMEFPVNSVESFSVFMDCENAKVTIKTCTHNPATIEINARRIFIDGYAASLAEMERRQDEKRWKAVRDRPAATDAAPTDAERAKQAVSKMRDGFQNASGTARAFIGGTARDCNS